MTFLFALADIKQTVKAGFVQLSKGGIVFIYSLRQIFMQECLYLGSVSFMLLLRDSSILSQANDVRNKLNAFAFTDNFLSKENPVRNQAEVFAIEIRK